MIEVRDLIKTFDGFRALNGLDLSIPAGSVYGLVGPNGAGKSTVIRHITGILRQDSGSVTVDHLPVYENPEVKSRIAYIPDEIFYYQNSTIDDMMQFYKSIYPRFSMQRYESLREAFELDSSCRIRRMSKGMQKQAAFWLAVSCCPDVLVLDEPVDGLDPVMRRQVWNIVLSDVASNGTTVLISSHNLRELEDVCDHVGMMDSGKMLIERSLSDLQDNIVKVQLAYDEAHTLPEELALLHCSSVGRVQQLILRGTADEISAQIAASSPLFYDVLPLTLEEIFIYEIGGTGYAVKDIIL